MQNFEVSVLDLAPVKQGKTVNDTFQESLSLANHAENLDYKRFWLAEHHNMESIASSATSVLIGFIANGTKKNSRWFRRNYASQSQFARYC